MFLEIDEYLVVFVEKVLDEKLIIFYVCFFYGFYLLYVFFCYFFMFFIVLGGVNIF